MNIVITNHTAAAVPVMSSDEGGWCESAGPNDPLSISKAGSNDLIIGDKPSVSEQIIKGLGVVTATVRKVLSLRNKPEASPKSVDADMVDVTIGNNGPAAVRVILGDGVTSAEVAPGAQYRALAEGYVEVRELGLAPKQGGTPK